MNENQEIGNEKTADYYRSEIAKTSPSTRRRAFEKFALAALGSIPWVGGFISVERGTFVPSVLDGLAQVW